MRSPTRGSSKPFASAAWNLYEEAKGKGGLEGDLITLNPPFLYGLVIHEVPPLEGFGGTAGMRYTTTTLSWEN